MAAESSLALSAAESERLRSLLAGDDDDGDDEDELTFGTPSADIVGDESPGDEGAVGSTMLPADSDALGDTPNADGPEESDGLEEDAQRDRPEEDAGGYEDERPAERAGRARGVDDENAAELPSDGKNVEVTADEENAEAAIEVGPEEAIIEADVQEDVTSQGGVADSLGVDEASQASEAAAAAEALSPCELTRDVSQRFRGSWMAKIDRPNVPVTSFVPSTPPGGQPAERDPPSRQSKNPFVDDDAFEKSPSNDNDPGGLEEVDNDAVVDDSASKSRRLEQDGEERQHRASASSEAAAAPLAVLEDERLCLPTSLLVCRHGHGLRLRGRHAWSLPLDASTVWSIAAELCATVLVGYGFVCRELCSGDCGAFAVNHACGPELPALVATRPQQPTKSSPASSSPRLVVASGALPSKRRALVAGVLVVPGSLGPTPSEDAIAARALAELRAAVEENVLGRVPNRDSPDELDFAGPRRRRVLAREDDCCDPTFVADLRRAFAAELDGNLVAYAKPLDEMVGKEELRAAQLMALLSPAYSAAGVAIPRPGRAPPLSSFPLLGARPELVGVFPEGGNDSTTTDVVAERLLDEAARRREDSGDDAKPLTARVIDELREWSSAEASARTRRKAAAVAARLQNAETHAFALVRTLAEDRKKFAKRRVSLFTSSSSERKFASLFRIADTDGDALFYDCAAFSVPAKRAGAAPGGGALVAGRLYVAASGCYWHTAGVLGLGGGSQAVVPYFTLARVELRHGLVDDDDIDDDDDDGTSLPPRWDHQATSSADKLGQLKAGARRAAAAVSVAAAKAVETVANLADERLARVALVDTSGRATLFFLPPSPTVPEHARRVVDLLQIAKAVDDDARKHNQKRGGQTLATPDAGRDEVAILERVQKISEISERNARLLDAATAAYSGSATSSDASSLAALAERGLGAVKRIPSSLSMLSGGSSSPKPPDPSPDRTPTDERAVVAEILAGRSAASDTPPPTSDEARNRRLSNLQAFLDQAHQKQMM